MSAKISIILNCYDTEGGVGVVRFSYPNIVDDETLRHDAERLADKMVEVAKRDGHRFTHIQACDAEDRELADFYYD